MASMLYAKSDSLPDNVSIFMLNMPGHEDGMWRDINVILRSGDEVIATHSHSTIHIHVSIKLVFIFNQSLLLCCG
jgi:hypothetical protein